ncbi:PREDICTED: uncharacterized protein LOC106310797 isoform X1 [Brassica oleracea var. oleracea]|uniref:uncharacterized protein LOC106310797 isoform X1 n=1 Tax=Brassica oleracea var. oleracea TaxID=109376 RepID=UPI0006A7086A|nr:PREDICTED: uncharacterized protein LOC106310797 isoform X1 [Brassica oleracea var. oleracea]
MESSLGFMAVFAVSGSVVFVASQFHKRLLSDYLDKFELEILHFVIGSPDNAVIKKKVRFAADVVEPSGNNKEYRRRHSSKAKFNRELKLAATI